MDASITFGESPSFPRHTALMVKKAKNEALGQRIRHVRENLLDMMSQEEFGRSLGVSRGAVGNWELGGGAKRESLLKISEVYGVSFEWLASGKGVAPVARDQWNGDEPDATIGTETGVRGLASDASPQIDVTAGMGGGGLTILSEGVPGKAGMTFAAEHVRDYWRLPPSVLAALGLRASDVSILMVQGDSMHPTINEGDFVFIDTRHRWPSPDGLYALADSFGGIVVKRLEISREPTEDSEGQVRVISDNSRHAPKTQTIEETRIIGRVIRRFGVVG